jgi:Domain of unknown function (DUF2017)
VRKWKRVDTANGPRIRSSLAAHEAALLQSLVTSVLSMLDDRESSAPSDELSEITGIKEGNPSRPQDQTMARLLPDFYRSERNHPAGSAAADSLNGALRSLHEPEIIETRGGEAAAADRACRRWPVRADRGRRQRVDHRG